MYLFNVKITVQVGSRLVDNKHFLITGFFRGNLIFQKSNINISIHCNALVANVIVVFTPYLPRRVLDSGKGAHSVTQNRSWLRIIKFCRNIWKTLLIWYLLQRWKRNWIITGLKQEDLYIVMSFTWQLKNTHIKNKTWKC